MHLIFLLVQDKKQQQQESRRINITSANQERILPFPTDCLSVRMTHSLHHSSRNRDGEKSTRLPHHSLTSTSSSLKSSAHDTSSIASSSTNTSQSSCTSASSSSMEETASASSCASSYSSREESSSSSSSSSRSEKSSLETFDLTQPKKRSPSHHFWREKKIKKSNQSKLPLSVSSKESGHHRFRTSPQSSHACSSRSPSTKEYSSAAAPLKQQKGRQQAGKKHQQSREKKKQKEKVRVSSPCSSQTRGEGLEHEMITEMREIEAKTEAAPSFEHYTRERPEGDKDAEDLDVPSRATAAPSCSPSTVGFRVKPSLRSSPTAVPMNSTSALPPSYLSEPTDTAGASSRHQDPSATINTAPPLASLSVSPPHHPRGRGEIGRTSPPQHQAQRPSQLQRPTNMTTLQTSGLPMSASLLSVGCSAASPLTLTPLQQPHSSRPSPPFQTASPCSEGGQGGDGSKRSQHGSVASAHPSPPPSAATGFTSHPPPLPHTAPTPQAPVPPRHRRWDYALLATAAEIGAVELTWRYHEVAIGSRQRSSPPHTALPAVLTGNESPAEAEAVSTSSSSPSRHHLQAAHHEASQDEDGLNEEGDPQRTASSSRRGVLQRDNDDERLSPASPTAEPSSALRRTQQTAQRKEESTAARRNGDGDATGQRHRSRLKRFSPRAEDREGTKILRMDLDGMSRHQRYDLLNRLLTTLELELREERVRHRRAALGPTAAFVLLEEEEEERAAAALLGDRVVRPHPPSESEATNDASPLHLFPSAGTGTTQRISSGAHVTLGSALASGMLPTASVMPRNQTTNASGGGAGVLLRSSSNPSNAVLRSFSQQIHNMSSHHSSRDKETTAAASSNSLLSSAAASITPAASGAPSSTGGVMHRMLSCSSPPQCVGPLLTVAPPAFAPRNFSPVSTSPISEALPHSLPASSPPHFTSPSLSRSMNSVSSSVLLCDPQLFSPFSPASGDAGGGGASLLSFTSSPPRHQTSISWDIPVSGPSAPQPFTTNGAGAKVTKTLKSSVLTLKNTFLKGSLKRKSTNVSSTTIASTGPGATVSPSGVSSSTPFSTSNPSQRQLLGHPNNSQNPSTKPSATSLNVTGGALSLGGGDAAENLFLRAIEHLEEDVERPASTEVVPKCLNRTTSNHPHSVSVSGGSTSKLAPPTGNKSTAASAAAPRPFVVSTSSSSYFTKPNNNQQNGGLRLFRRNTAVALQMKRIGSVGTTAALEGHFDSCPTCAAARAARLPGGENVVVPLHGHGGATTPVPVPPTSTEAPQFEEGEVADDTDVEPPRLHFQTLAVLVGLASYQPPHLAAVRREVRQRSTPTSPNSLGPRDFWASVNDETLHKKHRRTHDGTPSSTTTKKKRRAKNKRRDENAVTPFTRSGASGGRKGEGGRSPSPEDPFHSTIRSAVSPRQTMASEWEPLSARERRKAVAEAEMLSLRQEMETFVCSWLRLKRRIAAVFISLHSVGWIEEVVDHLLNASAVREAQAVAAHAAALQRTAAAAAEVTATTTGQRQSASCASANDVGAVEDRGLDQNSSEVVGTCASPSPPPVGRVSEFNAPSQDSAALEAVLHRDPNEVEEEQSAVELYHHKPECSYADTVTTTQLSGKSSPRTSAGTVLETWTEPEDVFDVGSSNLSSPPHQTRISMTSLPQTPSAQGSRSERGNTKAAIESGIKKPESSSYVPPTRPLNRKHQRSSGVSSPSSRGSGGTASSPSYSSLATPISRGTKIGAIHPGSPSLRHDGSTGTAWSGSASTKANRNHITTANGVGTTAGKTPGKSTTSSTGHPQGHNCSMSGSTAASKSKSVATAAIPSLISIDVSSRSTGTGGGVAVLSTVTAAGDQTTTNNTSVRRSSQSGREAGGGHRHLTSSTPPTPSPPPGQRSLPTTQWSSTPLLPASSPSEGMGEGEGNSGPANLGPVSSVIASVLPISSQHRSCAAVTISWSAEWERATSTATGSPWFPREGVPPRKDFVTTEDAGSGGGESRRPSEQPTEAAAALAAVTAEPAFLRVDTCHYLFLLLIHGHAGGVWREACLPSQRRRPSPHSSSSDPCPPAEHSVEECSAAPRSRVPGGSSSFLFTSERWGETQNTNTSTDHPDPHNRSSTSVWGTTADKSGVCSSTTSDGGKPDYERPSFLYLLQNIGLLTGLRAFSFCGLKLRQEEASSRATGPVNSSSFSSPRFSSKSITRKPNEPSRVLNGPHSAVDRIWKKETAFSDGVLLRDDQGGSSEEIALSTSGSTTSNDNEINDRNITSTEDQLEQRREGDHKTKSGFPSRRSSNVSSPHSSEECPSLSSSSDDEEEDPVVTTYREALPFFEILAEKFMDATAVTSGTIFRALLQSNVLLRMALKHPCNMFEWDRVLETEEHEGEEDGEPRVPTSTRVFFEESVETGPTAVRGVQSSSVFSGPLDVDPAHHNSASVAGSHPAEPSPPPRRSRVSCYPLGDGSPGTLFMSGNGSFLSSEFFGSPPDVISHSAVLPLSTSGLGAADNMKMDGRRRAAVAPFLPLPIPPLRLPTMTNKTEFCGGRAGAKGQHSRSKSANETEDRIKNKKPTLPDSVTPLSFEETFPGQLARHAFSPVLSVCVETWRSLFLLLGKEPQWAAPFLVEQMSGMVQHVFLPGLEPVEMPGDGSAGEDLHCSDAGGHASLFSSRQKNTDESGDHPTSATATTAAINNRHRGGDPREEPTSPTYSASAPQAQGAFTQAASSFEKRGSSGPGSSPSSQPEAGAVATSTRAVAQEECVLLLYYICASPAFRKARLLYSSSPALFTAVVKLAGSLGNGLQQAQNAFLDSLRHPEVVDEDVAAAESSRDDTSGGKPHRGRGGSQRPKNPKAFHCRATTPQEKFDAFVRATQRERDILLLLHHLLYEMIMNPQKNLVLRYLMWSNSAELRRLVPLLRELILFQQSHSWRSARNTEDTISMTANGGENPLHLVSPRLGASPDSVVKSSIDSSLDLGGISRIDAVAARLLRVGEQLEDRLAVRIEGGVAGATHLALQVTEDDEDTQLDSELDSEDDGEGRSGEGNGRYRTLKGDWNWTSGDEGLRGGHSGRVALARSFSITTSRGAEIEKSKGGGVAGPIGRSSAAATPLPGRGAGAGMGLHSVNSNPHHAAGVSGGSGTASRGNAPPSTTTSTATTTGGGGWWNKTPPPAEEDEEENLLSHPTTTAQCFLGRTGRRGGTKNISDRMRVRVRPRRHLLPDEMALSTVADGHKAVTVESLLTPFPLPFSTAAAGVDGIQPALTINTNFSPTTRSFSWRQGSSFNSLHTCVDGGLTPFSAAVPPPVTHGKLSPSRPVTAGHPHLSSAAITTIHPAAAHGGSPMVPVASVTTPCSPSGSVQSTTTNTTTTSQASPWPSPSFAATTSPFSASPSGILPFGPTLTTPLPHTGAGGEGGEGVSRLFFTEGCSRVPHGAGACEDGRKPSEGTSGCRTKPIGGGGVPGAVWLNKSPAVTRFPDVLRRESANLVEMLRLLPSPSLHERIAIENMIGEMGTAQLQK